MTRTSTGGMTSRSVIGTTTEITERQVRSSPANFLLVGLSTISYNLLELLGSK